MVAGCGMKIVKLLMVFVNVCVFLAGCAILGLGSWIKSYENKYEDLLGSNNIEAITILMICTGCALFLVGFFGCCGAWKERPIFLKIYFLLVITLVITEFVAGIMALVYRDDVYDDVQKQLSKQIESEYGETKAVTESVDNLQEELKCCGAANYSDYEGTEWAKSNPLVAVPESCCKQPASALCNAGTPGNPTSTLGMYTQGCVQTMYDWIEDNLTILGAVCLGLLGVQIVALMFSCCLIKAIQEEK